MIAKVFNACRNSDGAISRKKVALVGAIAGFIIAILVVIAGIFIEIKSPSVVETITVSVIGAPYLTFITSYFERSKKC